MLSLKTEEETADNCKRNARSLNMQHMNSFAHLQSVSIMLLERIYNIAFRKGIIESQSDLGQDKNSGER